MPTVKLRCRIGPRMLPPIKFFLEKDFPLMVMALDGIKVLDLSRLAPGPFCSMLLADFGADVTLVEAVPGASDKLSSMRAMQGGEAAEKAAAYNALGRGKKSIALNLKDSAARDIFYELVKGADVVLEGFRPGVVKRLGVDYETLAKINPRIICCSISGFGQTGPYSNLVGHDLNYISVGGALGVTGESAKPAIPINLVADFAGGGLTAAWGICMAVIARERTGRGQNVDVGMSDGVLALMTSAFIQYFSSGETIKRGQSLLNGLSPFYNIYECSDGRWFSIGSIEPHFYQALCKVLGMEDLADRAVRPVALAGHHQAFPGHLQDEDGRRVDDGHVAVRHLRDTRAGNGKRRHQRAQPGTRDGRRARFPHRQGEADRRGAEAQWYARWPADDGADAGATHRPGAAGHRPERCEDRGTARGRGGSLTAADSVQHVHLIGRADGCLQPGPFAVDEDRDVDADIRPAINQARLHTGPAAVTSASASATVAAGTSSSRGIPGNNRTSDSGKTTRAISAFEHGRLN